MVPRVARGALENALLHIEKNQSVRSVLSILQGAGWQHCLPIALRTLRDTPENIWMWIMHLTHTTLWQILCAYGCTSRITLSHFFYPYYLLGITYLLQM